MSAFRKLPGTRNVDLRLYGQQLLGVGPENITEEDYLRVGGKKAFEFFNKYKGDPLITDLLNRYQYATYGSVEEANPLTTFDTNDPAYGRSVRDFDGPITISNMPDILDLPIKNLNDLKKELERAVEGQGVAAPQISSDETEREERRLENFQRQARKDLVNFKDFLGEEVSEEERERAFRYKVDYGEDFTPIGSRKNVEYEPNIDIGYTAPFLNRDYEPITRTPKSDFTAIDPNQDLEYTPLEELLTPEPEEPKPGPFPVVYSSQGGLVGLPIVARQAGGNGNSSNSSSNGSNGQTEAQKERSEMENIDYMEDDTEAPTKGEDEGLPETDEDKIKEQIDQINQEIKDEQEKQEREKREAEMADLFEEFDLQRVGVPITDPPVPDPDPKTYQQTVEEEIKAKTGIDPDPIDVQNVIDARRDIFEKGLAVDVGIDFQIDPDDPTGKPESSTLGFSGPDATDYALSQIAEAFGTGLDLAEDFGKGMYAVTPLSLITSGLFGDPKDKYSVGARAMEGFGFEVPFPNALDSIKSALDFSQEETIKGQSPDPTSITGQDLEALNKSELDKLSFQDRNEVEAKAEDLSKVANISYNQALAVALDDYFGLPF